MAAAAGSVLTSGRGPVVADAPLIGALDDGPALTTAMFPVGGEGREYSG